ncbi:MAG: cytochrome-c oxidase, cbb3-type subunit II [Candidatus Competibacteraceae bacterium]|nr:cytochrome-c oxidase, cbb3-type subunit II [Candidatus Competibacteraceae bacterium]
MRHEHIETNSALMLVLILLVISIGGLVEIVPLFYINETLEKVDGVRPYTPLEIRGRDIYVREGCYLCHSQQIRPFRDEWLRYGHYSLAAESQYDHPFQWGSKRTGPDLARLGGKYSDQWHVQHLKAPRSVVPQSIMPNYPWLLDNDLDYKDVGSRMRALRITGVPYSVTQAEYDANVQKYGQAIADQLDISKAQDSLLQQAREKNFDGLPDRITEMEALIAYLQVLGTMVDFTQYDEGYFVEFR